MTTQADIHGADYTGQYNAENNIGPNAAMIRREGVRLVGCRIPAQVRKELMDCVKRGLLGYLPKEGLKPQAFFHPNALTKAKELRSKEANAGIKAIASVMVSASDPTPEQQKELNSRFA